VSGHDWPWATLDEVATVTAGNPAPQGAEFFERGSRPFVRVQDLGRLNGTSHLTETADLVNDRAAATLKLFPRGSVLFTKSGASLLLNQRAILSRDMHVVSHIGVAVPGPRITSEWLYYWLRTVDFADIAHGANMPSFPLSRVKQLRVPVPPVTEQCRYVAEIEKQFSRLDKAVANLKRVKANLKRYTAAVFNVAVAGRLAETEAERARREGRSYETGEQLLHRILELRRSRWKGAGEYKEPAAPDRTLLPELPEGWVWASAEQVSDFITKGTTPASEKLSEGTGEVPFLKVYNLTFDGSLNHSYRPTFVSRKTHEGELARSRVQAGDVLINIVGPPLGQVSVVPPTIAEANVNQAIARFRPISPLSSAFLSVALLTKDVMRWAIRRAKTTAGQSNLTLEVCRALPIPLPPTDEQIRIVEEVERRLSLLREAEFRTKTILERAERMRQSTLERTFGARVAHLGGRTMSLDTGMSSESA